MTNPVLQEDFQSILSQPLLWHKLENKTILITGAGGFLSSFLIGTLLQFNQEQHKNLKIIGLGRNREKITARFSPYKKRPDLKLIIADICEPLTIKDKVDYIIHAASQANPSYYQTDPVGTIKANTLGTYNLLELARKNNPESFVFISAGEIYGQSTEKTITEETSGYLDPLEIRSAYAQSKRLGEALCAAYTYQYQIPAKIIRLFNTYGPGFSPDDHRVFTDFLMNIIRKEDIIIKSDGQKVRPFCYLADAAAGIFTVLFKGKDGEAYNLANDEQAVSINQLAEIMVKAANKKLKIIHRKRTIKDSYLETKISAIIPSTAKLRSLGWHPRYPINQGLLRTLRTYYQSS